MAKEPVALRSTKLSFKLKHELEQLPDKIDALEKELEDLQETANAPAFYTQDYEKSAPTLERIGACKKDIERAVERWAALEKMQAKVN